MSLIVLNWDLASVCKEWYGGGIGEVHDRSVFGIYYTILWVLEYSRLEDILIS